MKRLYHSLDGPEDQHSLSRSNILCHIELTRCRNSILKHYSSRSTATATPTTIIIMAAKLTIIVALGLFCLFSIGHGHDKLAKRNKQKIISGPECDRVPGFSVELKNEIHSKALEVNRLMDLVLNGTERHSTYDELAYFCDNFGPRLSGSQSLADAIRYMTDKMRTSNLEIRNEKAMIPRWKIGDQWAEMVKPVRRPMSILAFGFSVGTNKTIEAEVVVVNSFDQLSSLGADGKINGKIVVFNYNFTTYGESVLFRTQGASRAAKHGALAALVRSVAPFSIYSAHTGVASKSIPTAALTIEDTDLIQRWTDRRKRVVLKLFIDARNYEDEESENVIGDLTGHSKPDEIVLVSGHIDSWYNTQGAMDDGGGMMISYKALDLLSKLGLRAKRTLRAVLWTSEEFGLYGVRQYVKNHQHELDKFKVVMESDLGTFQPLGLSVINASPLMQCVIGEVLKLTQRIGTTKLDSNYEGSDIEQFTDQGTLGLSLLNENNQYFMFHHTSGDSMTVENPESLDKSTILWAAASYVLADLSIELK